MRSSFLLIAALATPLMGAPNVRVISAEPTVLFPRGTPLQQIAYVTLLNEESQPVQCEISAKTPGDAGPAVSVKAMTGSSRHRVLVPDIASPVEVQFTIRVSGQVVAQKKYPWQPQRKWKLYIVKSSHEDL